MSENINKRGFTLLSRLSVSLLGSFRVDLGPQRITEFRYDKVRALFAYLVTEAGAHRREVLAEMFWPEQPEGVARGNLRQALATLRKVLGTGQTDGFLICDRESVEFRAEAVDLDVSRFLRLLEEADRNRLDWQSVLPCLESAVAIYLGEFLTGLALPLTGNYEEWVESRRAFLRAKYVNALQDLSRGLDASGETRLALQYNERLLAAEPWQEESHRRQMQLITRLGQREAALHHYEQYQRRLAEEIGVLPEPETTLLSERIAKGLLLADKVSEVGLHLAPERRQLTVLSCTLDLGACDPEEILDVLEEFREQAQRAVQREQGFVGGWQGTEMRAYFGYPQALEEAGRNAIQAALAIQRAPPAGRQARIGIHTGMAVVSGDRGTPEVIGVVPRLAAALMQYATPGSILIGPSVHSLTAGYFRCRAQGPRYFSDVQRELDVFEVEGETPARGRLEAAVASGLITPFIGREREYAELHRHWEGARGGAGRAVLLSGEAGIGKSRLALRLKKSMKKERASVFECHCSLQHRSSPDYLISTLIKQLCGIDELDDDRICLTKIETQLGKTDFAQGSFVAMMAHFLSLPPTARYGKTEFSPAVVRNHVLEMLLALLAACAARQPVLLWIEDLHWIDRSSQDLMGKLLEGLSAAPILVVMTARPEYAVRLPNTSAIPLGSLPYYEAVEVAESVAKGQLSPTLIDAIVRWTDGVPLFLEEMVRMVMNKEGASEILEKIPSTLYDLLMLRVDLLGAAKPTAQLGAALGREFSHQLLRALSLESEETLREHLELLLESGLLFKRELRHDTVYWFKHALVQEAAYRSQLKRDRQSVHGRVAETLLTRFPAISGAQPQLVAQHLTAAGHDARAVDYWMRAGRLSIKRSANPEAIEQLQQGLRLVENLPQEASNKQLRLELLIALGVPVINVCGYGSREATDVYNEIRALSTELGAVRPLFKALWGLRLSASSRSDYGEACALAGELLQIAEREKDSGLLMRANNAMGTGLFWRGEFAESRRHLRQVIRLYSPAEHDAQVYEFGDCSTVTSLAYLAWISWFHRGESERAVELCEEAIKHAREIDHPYSLGFALTFATVVRFLRNEPALAEPINEELLRLAKKHRFNLWLATGTAYRGWAEAAQGRYEALGRIEQALETLRQAMPGIEVALLVPLARAYGCFQDYPSVLTVLERAFRVAERTQVHFFDAELLRLKGEALLWLLPERPERAEGCFEKALTISRRQRALMLELRVAVSLGRLWMRQGRKEEAKGVLIDVYQGFHEGFDTYDLKEAATVLRQLGVELENLR